MRLARSGEYVHRFYTAPMLQTVELETGRNPATTILWFHGLGADGHDFEPIAPEIVGPGDPPVRFVFPHAPRRPITLNGGYEMRGWYDVIAIDRESPQDEKGIRESDAEVHALIRRENERGIPTGSILLAGFSQGGALALFSGLRHPEKLGGIIALSCYLPLVDSFDAERQAANQHTPLFMAHGVQDPIVSFALAEESRRLLEARGYPLEWRTYSMPHSVCQEEIAHIAAWLRRARQSESTEG